MQVTATPDSMQSSFATISKGKVEKKSGKRIGHNYIILKSFKESQKNDVIKCFYIKSLTNFGLCVIKEGSYGDSKDKHGRDIIDRLKWQEKLHKKLQGKIHLPRLLDHFEENGNYYLVLELIRGNSLNKIFRDKHKEMHNTLITGSEIGCIFIEYLLKIVNLLITLHKNQVVHRDATINNFIITPKGEVAVVDLELSYSLLENKPFPPYQLGTLGYMSPEQLATQTPTIMEDVFSVGAILLQIWTGLSPLKLTDAPAQSLLEKVYFFVTDKVIADIIIQCLQANATQRPSLQKVHDILFQLKKDLLHKKPRQQSNSVTYSKEQIKTVIQDAFGSLATPLLADKSKGWFAEDMNIVHNRDKNKINKAWYASFNRGASGILYLLSKGHRLGFDVSMNNSYINKALDLIESKYVNRIEHITPGLHFGSSGIATCLSQSIKDGLIQPNQSYIEWINVLLKVANHSFNFTHGVSGQGMAFLLSKDQLDLKTANEHLLNYINRLLQTQEKDGSWVNNTSKQKKRQGFATGVAGIACFLIEYAHCYQYTPAFVSAEKALNWLISRSIHKGEIINWEKEKNKELMHGWNEGAPGIALAFMKAYSNSGNPIYKKYAKGALLNYPKNALSNNLSQQEGLSGIGEIYLEAYSIFKDEEWIQRAEWVAQVLIHLKKEHSKYGPYWLVRHEGQPTADFMTGNSGIIHFLLRYCYPDKVGFPLLYNI